MWVSFFYLYANKSTVLNQFHNTHKNAATLHLHYRAIFRTIENKCEIRLQNNKQVSECDLLYYSDMYATK